MLTDSMVSLKGFPYLLGKDVTVMIFLFKLVFFVKPGKDVTVMIFFLFKQVFFVKPDKKRLFGAWAKGEKSLGQS